MDKLKFWFIYINLITFTNFRFSFFCVFRFSVEELGQRKQITRVLSHSNDKSFDSFRSQIPIFPSCKTPRKLIDFIFLKIVEAFVRKKSLYASLRKIKAPFLKIK